MTALLDRFVVATLAVLAVSCQRSRSPHPEAAGTKTTAARTRVSPTTRPAPSEGGGPDAAPAKPALTPLAGTEPLVSLDVEGHAPAIVALPLGATEPRPLVVAMHGNFDRPEWQCEVWRDVTGGYPFVLCPRGMARNDVPKSMDRWTYAGGKPAEQELFAGIEALGAKYAEYIAPGPVVFIGFSLGAIIGAGLVRRHGERFPRVVLIEGGNESWSRANAAKYAEAGGQRVLFACGQVGCKHLGRNAARVLEAAKVSTQVVFGGNIGHTYDAQVADAVAAQWSWLVEGDERWLDEP